MQYSVKGKCSSCTHLSNQGVQSKVASFKKPVMMLIINLDANTIIAAVKSQCHLFEEFRKRRKIGFFLCTHLISKLQ